MDFDSLVDYYNQVQDLFSNSFFQDYGVIGLFLNSLLSATAIPLPTEILTSALLLGGESEFLVGIALLSGSTVGGLLNYLIGFGGNKLFSKLKKANNDDKQETKSNRLLHKFGWGAVFFASWIPVVGDLILISAGAKRMKFTKFVVFMISGKAVKTVAVVSGLGLVF